MSGTWNRRTFGGATMAIVTAVGLLANPPVGAAQSSREADGARLLKERSTCTSTWTRGLPRGLGEAASRKCRWRARLVCGDS